jgi:hypothetical protein
MKEEDLDFGKIKNYCDSNYAYYCKVMAEIFYKSDYKEKTDLKPIQLNSSIFFSAPEPKKLEIGNGKYDQIIFHKNVTDKLLNKSLPSFNSIEVGHRLEVWHKGWPGQTNWNVKDILEKNPSYSDINIDDFIMEIPGKYDMAYRNIEKFDSCIVDAADRNNISQYPLVPYIAENLPSTTSIGSKVNYYKVLYLLFVGGVFNFFKILEILLKRKYLGLYCGGIDKGREHMYYERLAEIYVQIEKIVNDGFNIQNDDKQILLNNILNEYKKVIAADTNIIPSETEETKQKEFKEVGKTGVGVGDVLLGVGLAGLGYGLYKKFKKSRRKSSSKSSEDESQLSKRRKGYSSSGHKIKKKRVSKKRR